MNLTVAAPSPIIRALLPVLGLIVLSVLEFRVVTLIQQANLPEQVDVAAGILAGQPYWKAYQNRLLGPGLVAGWSQLTGRATADAYQHVSFACVLLANAVALRVFSRLTGGQRSGAAWAATVAYAGLFAAFQDPQWLYLWDFVDLTTMLLFAAAVVAGPVPWPWLAGLFAVELLNRESALFIALWLGIEAFTWGRRGTANRRWEIPRLAYPARLAVGMGLGAAGVLWTGWVRQALCAGETGVLPRAEIWEFAGGQFFMLPVTLGLWREPWTLATASLLALLGATVILLVRARGRLGARIWPVGLLVAALVGANFCFAYVLELRVWLPMLPLLLCLACRGPRSGETAPPGVAEDRLRAVRA